MVDLSHACVLCKETTGLNTRSTIKVTEEEYQVAVCTACEDSASPKVMRTSLVGLLERTTAVCKELGSYLGREITLESLCCPKAPPPTTTSPIVQETVEAATGALNATAPAAPGGVRVVNKPIQRDQRRSGGGAPPAAPRQKVAEQPRDAAGNPIANLPKGVVVLENQEPVKSDLRSAVGERQFNDGYNTCHRCNGDGGTNSGGKTVLCQACNGSGLL